MKKTEDSLQKRYLFKLIANFISIPVGLFSEMIVPRSLGSARYGDFTFLTNQFSYFTNLLENGVSTAFYTKLSQRLNEPTLVKFYWFYAFLVSLLLFLSVPVLSVFGQLERFFPKQEVPYIWLGLGYGLLLWNSRIISQMVDAYGLTTKGEMITIIQKILGAVLIAILFFFEKLSLRNFFFYHYFLMFLSGAGWAWVLLSNKIAVIPFIKLTFEQIKIYVKEFYVFIHPLITLSVVGALVSFLDTWLLQQFAGSQEQGYFGLAYRLSAVSFLAASAMIPLITREFSIAFEQKNKELLRQLFDKNMPLLYFIVCYFSVFLAFNASKITAVFGGDDFKNAGAAFTLMALYPIHQIYGQMTGALTSATNQTKLYRNVGIVTNLISLPLGFFLIAKPQYFGLDLGALGLAIKFVATQFVGVSVLLWFCVKYLELSFGKFMFHQIYTFLGLAFLAYITHYFSDFILVSSTFTFLFSGFSYSILVILLIYAFPSLLNTNRTEIKKMLFLLKEKIKTFRK